MTHKSEKLQSYRVKESTKLEEHEKRMMQFVIEDDFHANFNKVMFQLHMIMMHDLQMRIIRYDYYSHDRLYLVQCAI